MKHKWEEHLPYLQLLLKAHTKQRKSLIEIANRDQIRILSEIVYNLLDGNIPITKLQKEKLRPYERKFLMLINETKGLKDLRHMWIKNSKKLITVLLTNTLQYLQ